jgi:hypothetical protein
MKKEALVAEDRDPAKLPGTFKAFITKFPALGEAHEAIAKAVDAAGPLDRKMCELVKIGLSTPPRKKGTEFEQMGANSRYNLWSWRTWRFPCVAANPS